MSDYGLKIYNYQGTKVIYDSSMVTWNQVDTFLGSNLDVNYSFPGKEMLAMYFFVYAPSVNTPTYLPTINYDNSKLTVRPRSDNLQQDVTGLVLMR